MITLPEIHARQRFVVGVSSGKDSVGVLLWAVRESGLPVNQIIATFCDTENEHEFTYRHIEYLSKNVHPIITLKPRVGFFELAAEKKGFPGAKRRFCTEVLKIQTALEFIQGIRGQVLEPIAISGVRADESEDRASLLEWDYSGNLLCREWRPLIRWTLKDVLEIHNRHGIPLNPLYSFGARRVGCFPCIMSIKEEVRIIALNFPERIAKIREWEQKISAELGRPTTFFRANVCPPRFCSQPYHAADGRIVMVPTIDDVVRWSMTGERAKGSWEDQAVKAPISCNSGFCE